MQKRGFLRGIGSIVNLIPKRQKLVFKASICSNEEAFQKDLQSIGSDIRLALKSIESHINKEEKHRIKF